MTLFQLPGRNQSRRCRCRQSCSSSGSRFRCDHCYPSCCPRCSYPQLPHDSQPIRRWLSTSHYRLVGQDCQVLGPATIEPYRIDRVPGACIHNGREEQAPSHRYCGPLHQRREPRHPDEILQDHAIPPQVADAGSQLLRRRLWLRRRQYRRSLCYPVRRG